MESENNTGFKDKTGHALYVDDIVQHRLGNFGKSGGSSTFKVIRFGKKYNLVAESSNDNKYGGTALTQNICENLVVIKSNHLPR